MVGYGDVLFVLQKIGRTHEGEIFQHSGDRCAVEVVDSDGNRSMVKITGFEVPKKEDKAKEVLKDIDEEMGILRTLQELTEEGKNPHNILRVQHSGKIKKPARMFMSPSKVPFVEGARHPAGPSFRKSASTTETFLYDCTTYQRNQRKWHNLLAKPSRWGAPGRPWVL